MDVNLIQNEIEISNGILNLSKTQDINVPEKEKSLVLRKQYQIIKRMSDVFFSLIGLILLSPLFLLLAVLIKIDSRGPAFFAHKRIGKDGKIIKIYKFRTMVDNAEDLIKEFTPEQLEQFKKNFKLENDPRITRVGKILRKTSLDELPQLLNILKGELSIIGPRPVVKEELERYGKNKEKFLSVTPGLTGYWAANGRSYTTYEQRMEMELYYIDNISFKTDIEIFLKTIFLVLKREGAM